MTASDISAKAPLAPKARRGFALPAVLAVTGVVTLIFLVAITALASLTAEAASARARLRFEVRAMSAEARLSYLAATEPLTAQAFAVGAPRALNDFETPPPVANDATGLQTFVNLDGRSYVMAADGLAITLQDQSGLVNLARLDETQMQRLPDQLGISPAKARTLRPTYLDYVDSDSLRQPNGAERGDYGTETPANRALLRPAELLSLLGVRGEVRPDRWRAVRPVLAADSGGYSLNVNTAPPLALQILFGLTPQQAQSAVTARKTAPFLSFSDFVAASGASIQPDDEAIYTFPSGRVIFTIKDTRSPWTYRARLTLNPFGLEQPVWIDQSELTEAPRRAAADTADATPFPYAPG